MNDKEKEEYIRTEIERQSTITESEINGKTLEQKIFNKIASFFPSEPEQRFIIFNSI